VQPLLKAKCLRCHGEKVKKSDLDLSTGAGILKGIVFLFIVTFLGALFLAERFHLENIQRMLSWLLSGSTIALIVLFAPEMRRGLSLLAQSRMLSPFLRSQSSGIVPYSVAGKSTSQVVAVYKGQRSAPFTVQVADSVPGLFSQNFSGTGPGAEYGLSVRESGSRPRTS
jgi:hypothetical protein